jgi:formylglycine-generating enzyme required for sulfatase activity
VAGVLSNAQGQSWRNPGFAQSGSHPALCLNWNDAKAYVAWLAKTTGKPYRLLTEAEWEYAARAGTTTAYFFGDDANDICRYGNGADQTARQQNAVSPQYPAAPCSDGYAYTSPVGSFPPNGFGLHDVHGDAWQWLEDCYHDTYGYYVKSMKVQTAAPSDGSAWLSGSCTHRVLRGASWDFVPQFLRVAFRGWDSPGNRFNIYGIRVGRTLGP